jgi:hypothetical protein
MIMTEAEIYDRLAERITDEVQAFVRDVSIKLPLLKAPDVKLEEMPDGQRMTLTLDFAVTQTPTE